MEKILNDDIFLQGKNQEDRVEGFGIEQRRRRHPDKKHRAARQKIGEVWSCFYCFYGGYLYDI